MVSRNSSGLMIRMIHDCEKPSMVIDTKTETYTERFWFKKETRTFTTNFYETRYAKWKCPVCKSEWSYNGSGQPEYAGHWRCDKRTVEWVER